MRTTLDIFDPLLRAARKVAAREKTTLRSLVERGLRKVVAEKERRPPFRLRKASFNGYGLRSELDGASWGVIRALGYRTHD